jgi:hypothetical protein
MRAHDNLTNNETMRPMRHLLTAVIAALTLAGVSALAEQRPNVIFIVDPLTDPAGDWATWVTPRIVLR